LNYENLIFLNANIRREGSSWLGTEEKWGVFPAVSLGMEATRFLNFEALSYLKIRSSFGIVGNTPIEGFLSKQRFQEGIIIFQNGEFNETGFFSTANANPFLAHETRRELNFGIDFGLYKNKIQGSLEFYNSKNQDLIQRNSVDSPPNFAPVSWLNSGGLSTNGLDFNLHFEMMKKADFSWNGSFQLSRFKTKVDKWGQLFPFLSMPGAPGFGSDFFVKIEEGEAIGNFYGHEFVSVGEDGFPIFRLPTNNFEDDQFILGNGLPKSSIGLRQVFNYKRFELDLFARGAFGHQMFNLPRLFYENRDRIPSDANVVKTSVFDPNLRGSGVVSDLYVEDAGYLKIDYISLGYNFDLTNQQFIRNLEFYVILQNPLIFTSYTGASPEVRLKDTGASDSGRLNGILELASFSIDRRNTYLPTRGWVIGLKIGL
jgi:iron complex outermembrane receptor protein